MRPYGEIEQEVSERQERARGWAEARRVRRTAAAGAPSTFRLRTAGGLRRLAAWIEGGTAANSVTLRPS